MQINLNSFKSILCLNGDIPPRNFFDQLPKLDIIAADGAGSILTEMNIIPTCIVGDFDSFNKDSVNKHTEYIRYSDQSNTDFEKCILEMQKRHLFPSLVCGAFGKEIDHALHNMHCLMKYIRKFPMVFYDCTISERPKYCIPVYDQFNFRANKADIISLLPYPEATVSTKGLKWDIDNELLSIGGISSIRNQAKNSKITIKLTKGQIVLICDI